MVFDRFLGIPAGVERPSQTRKGPDLAYGLLGRDSAHENTAGMTAFRTRFRKANATPLHGSGCPRRQPEEHGAEAGDKSRVRRLRLGWSIVFAVEQSAGPCDPIGCKRWVFTVHRLVALHGAGGNRDVSLWGKMTGPRSQQRQWVCPSLNRECVSAAYTQPFPGPDPQANRRAQQRRMNIERPGS